MIELIKMYKDGINKSEYFNEPTSIPFAELLRDNRIVSFIINKDSNDKKHECVIEEYCMS